VTKTSLVGTCFWYVQIAATTEADMSKGGNGDSNKCIKPPSNTETEEARNVHVAMAAFERGQGERERESVCI
jgi:hypothetical protein